MSWIEEEVEISKIDELLKQGYEVEVDSPDGYVPVNFFIDKGMHPEFILKLEDSTEIRCNEKHLFETEDGWVFAKDLSVLDKNVKFLTADGYQYGKVSATENVIPIVDINVNHPNHRYYTEGVSSHNTGVGKSLFMCHMAASSLSQNLNVLYITLEMAEERIAERIDANLLDITVEDLHQLPKHTYEKKIENLRKTTKGRLIIKEYPTASANVNHFRALLNELNLKRSFVPDIIFIDYLNICTSSRIKSGSNVNSYTFIKSIAEELRGMAVEHGVPLVSATQTTRSGFSSTDVGLEDTSESFGLPATADFMFAIISTEQMEELNQIMVKQLKNRYNDPTSNRKFVIGIDRGKMKLFDVDESEQDLIDSGQEDDTPVFDVSTGGKFKKRDFSGFDYE